MVWNFLPCFAIQEVSDLGEFQIRDDKPVVILIKDMNNFRALGKLFFRKLTCDSTSLRKFPNDSLLSQSQPIFKDEFFFFFSSLFCHSFLTFFKKMVISISN